MKILKDFDVKNKRVLVRCDFNVPLDDKGNILDDFRIKETIPTIEYLVRQGAKIILMSHLGRPKGRIVEELRLTPVQDKLREHLNLSVAKAQDCVGKEIEEWTHRMREGEVLLLENLRFHEEEERNEENFAQALSKLGDFYINDAFGVSHRSHASIVGVPKFLPSAAGFLLEREVKTLSNLMENPEKPLVAIIGGAKAEKKTSLINSISKVADFVLIGGLIQKEARDKNIQFEQPGKIIEPVDNIEEKDIGPETMKIFKEKIFQAKTVFWNGPVGHIEEREFTKGSETLARTIVESGAFSVAGGGETVEFINQLGLGDKFGHLSTGGGAMLEFLSGNVLPGLQALE